MNKDLLQQANSRMIIQNIFLHSCEIKTRDDFYPLDNKSYEIQFKQYVKDTKIFSALENDSQNPIELIIFHYIAAFRVLPECLSDEDKESEVSDKVEIEVIATFSAAYAMIEKIPQEAIDEFAEHNVGFNVWPYWREYASSTATRLGLPSFTIPLYRLPI